MALQNSFSEVRKVVFTIYCSPKAFCREVKWMTFTVLNVSIKFSFSLLFFLLIKGVAFLPRYFSLLLCFTDIFVNPLISLRVGSNVTHFGLWLFPESRRWKKINKDQLLNQGHSACFFLSVLLTHLFSFFGKHSFWMISFDHYHNPLSHF